MRPQAQLKEDWEIGWDLLSPFCKTDRWWLCQAFPLGGQRLPLPSRGTAERCSPVTVRLPNTHSLVAILGTCAYCSNKWM